MPARNTMELTRYGGDAAPRPGGASGQLRREITALLLVLTGLFVLVCLLAGPGGRSLVGSAGESVSRSLRFVLGLPMSFSVPVALVAWGVWTFLGRRVKVPPVELLTRGMGVLMAIAAMAGLLALPGADNPEVRTATFDRAGALGVFLVEWEGLRLVGRFGGVGAAMILAGLGLVGLAMTTNQGVSGLLGFVLRRNIHPGDEEGEASPAPPASKPARSRAAAAPPATGAADDGEEDDGETPPVPSRPLGRRVFSRIGNLFRRAPRDDRGAILAGLDEPTGWEDDVWDDDVAAAARALERHKLEAQALGRLRVREDDGRSASTDLEADEEEQDLFDSDDEAAYDDDEDYGPEEDEREDQDPGDDEDDAHEIVFQDHSGPLPVMSGNPANAKVGEGLAKLFPGRWPKEGVPAEADGEGNEELDQAEERHLRQLGAGGDGDGTGAPENDSEVSEDDPLFNSEIDTRPHGPNGEPLERETTFDVLSRESLGYVMPSLDLLADPPPVDARMTREEMLEMSETLTKTLSDFGVDGRVVEVHQGPVVTRFEFRPAAGIKVSRITGLEHDIAMGMKAISVRILAPIPGKNVVGIEVPNKKRQGVYLKELLGCGEFWEKQSPLSFALGKTIEGGPFYADLKKMPHLLIAGATGAGKSVCLNTIICSLLYRQTPDKVRLIMVDPKRVELSVYADIPHLMAPVVCEPKCAAAALEWAVEQMEERYKQLVELGVRNIDGYNRAVENPEGNRRARGRKLRPMPHLVIIVDELADLMLVAKADVEDSIQRLAQMARAVGIHLILATQRPSVNVITGVIKANFPSRIAFQVSQKVDSRTILDANGAEALLGRGDMLFSAGGAGKPSRIQGCFVSDDEVETIADHCRTQMEAHYEIEEFEPKLSEKEQRELAKMMNVSDMDDLDAQDRVVRGTNRIMGKVDAGMFIPHDGGSARAGDEEIDEALVRAAARLILESRKASVSLIQRRLKVGFARAGRLMDMLEEMGIVGEFKGSKPRDIVVDPEAAIAELDKLETALAQGASVEAIIDGDLEGDSGDEGDEYGEDEGEEDDPEAAGDPNAPW